MSRTTTVTRRAIQQSGESIRILAKRYAINPKTVAKWRRRNSVGDGRVGRRSLGGSSLTIEAQAMIVALRRQTLLPLDDCLTILQDIIPGISRTSLHRCLKQHGISRLPSHCGKSRGRSTANTPIGHFHVQVTQLNTEEGSLHLFTAIDRQSKFAFCQCIASMGPDAATAFLQSMIEAVPYRIHSIRTLAPAHSDRQYIGEAFQAACMTQRIAGHIGIESQTWSRQQLERISLTIKKATLHCDKSCAATKSKLDLERLLQRYNFRCRLRSLGGLTPADYAFKFAAPDQSYPRERLDAARRQAVSQRKKALPNRRRDPEITRETILRVARARLSHDGPGGLSVSEIARSAGISRGTAYLHFGTREALVKATVAGVSERLYRAVFGDSPEQHEARPFDRVDAYERAYHLATSVMENSELSRGWMLHVLSSAEPADDLFWREREAELARFAKSAFAQDGIDSEVLNLIMLGGAIFFSVWAASKAKSEGELERLAHRFAREVLRLSLYGVVRPEFYPQMVRRWGGRQSR